MTDRKAEIQGLRAIAVGSVLLFHIWPSLIPGGYVGVDVFFVISGYLITGLLFREAQATGSISLLAFYARRVRRLLPAATAVLVAVAIFLPLLPRARWQETIHEIVASALYVENWQLARLAVDYLGGENAPSPLQHYWSLSIEEQFYIAWPLIMLGVLAMARRTTDIRRAFFLVLLAIFSASLVASIVLTASDPVTAYFVTHTRVWELTLGGLLALVVLPPLSSAVREAMRVLGLAGIGIACVAFSTDTRFPGAAALLPTLGAALVIAAGKSSAERSTYKVLALRPMQYLGDISYSVYLWHWPLIVFASLHLADSRISPTMGGFILAATIVLAAASKRFIEDPFRHPAPTTPPLRSIASGATSVLGVVSASAVMLVVIQNSGTKAALMRSPDKYPSVRALSAGVPAPPVEEFVPALTNVRDDIADAYWNGCHVKKRSTELKPCLFGPPDAEFHVLLAGDSHAANWIPAFEELARTRGWRVETHTKSSCPLLVARVELRIRNEVTPYDACYRWGRRLLRHIQKTKPDVVVLAQSSGATLVEPGVPIEVPIVETWRRILKSGVRVVAMADTPRHPVDPVECIERDPACASDRHSVMRDNRFVAASRIEPRVATIDMNDMLCTQTQCPMVIGNVIVWRDKHHLTATYARDLAPHLGDRLIEAVGRERQRPVTASGR